MTSPQTRELGVRLGIAGLLAFPIAHPLLLPLVGAPSHLLWWVHVLPVALAGFRQGSRGAVGMMTVSLVLLVVGERLFGAGYGVPASWETVLSLAVALFGTHLLITAFALYARSNALRYQVLFDNAASAILRTDADGRIMAANPKACDLLRASEPELIGRPFSEGPWAEVVPDPHELAEGGWSGPITTTSEDGQAVTSYVTIAAAGGDPSGGYQLLLVDRTADVVRDRDLERQGRLATLGATLSAVAHEMKNPLQVIDSYAELALYPDSTEGEVRESLQTVRGQAARMNDLIRELLGFSRRSGGDGEKVRLHEIVGEVLRLQRVARGNSVRIDARLDEVGAVEADGAKVEQILVNLVSNAIDAVPRGRGVIEVTLDRQGDRALIEVADNGPGIPPEMLDRIFEPFVSTKTKENGTGLGLAISRRLARSMGGELTVLNREEGGAGFTLTIPIADPDERSTIPAEVEAEQLAASVPNRHP